MGWLKTSNDSWTSPLLSKCVILRSSFVANVKSHVVTEGLKTCYNFERECMRENRLCAITERNAGPCVPWKRMRETRAKWTDLPWKWKFPGDRVEIEMYSISWCSLDCFKLTGERGWSVRGGGRTDGWTRRGPLCKVIRTEIDPIRRLNLSKQMETVTEYECDWYTRPLIVLFGRILLY